MKERNYNNERNKYFNPLSSDGFFFIFECDIDITEKYSI